MPYEPNCELTKNIGFGTRKGSNKTKICGPNKINVNKKRTVITVSLLVLTSSFLSWHFVFLSFQGSLKFSKSCQTLHDLRNFTSRLDLLFQRYPLSFLWRNGFSLPHFFLLKRSLTFANVSPSAPGLVLNKEKYALKVYVSDEARGRLTVTVYCYFPISANKSSSVFWRLAKMQHNVELMSLAFSVKVDNFCIWIGSSE